MTDEMHPGTWQPRGLFIAAAIVIVLAGMRAATAIVIPVLLAVVVTVTAAPLQSRLIHRGVPRVLSFTIVTSGTAILVAGFFWLTNLSLSAFVADLPSYAPGARELLNDILQLGSALHIKLDHLVHVGQVVSETFNLADAVTRSVLSSIAGWTIALVLIGFMLYEALDFPVKMHAWLGEGTQYGRLVAFGRSLSEFMSVMTVGAVLTAVGDLAAMLALGVPSPLLWASLAFLLSYIPSVGAIIIAMPPTIATLVRFGYGRALAVFAILLLIDNIVGVLIVPRIVGMRLNVAPMWGMLSLIFWGWLLGPAGAILALPLTLFAKYLLESSPVTAPMGVLMQPVGPGAHDRPT